MKACIVELASVPIKIILQRKYTCIGIYKQKGVNVYIYRILFYEISDFTGVLV